MIHPVLVKDTNELPSILEDLERAVRSIESIKYVVGPSVFRQRNC